MAYFRVGLLFLVIVHCLLLLSHPVLCNDEDDHLLQGINSYRQSHKLTALTKNEKADCLADEIADQMEDQPCTSNALPNGAPKSQPLPKNYPDILSKCKIDPNTTKDGAILPVCVPKRIPTLVLTNYTQTQYAKYLNDSKYVGAGVGSENDWMVVVLTTNSPGGNFVSKANVVARSGLCYSFFLCLFLGLVNNLLM